MTLKDDLIAAKALIMNPAKWHRGEMSDDEGECFCALGAAFLARQGDIFSWDDEAELALEKAIPPEFEADGRGRRVAQYNDHPDTTHADVMALFDRAIASAE